LLPLEVAGFDVIDVRPGTDKLEELIRDELEFTFTITFSRYTDPMRNLR
jgi:hypothetical protein